MPLRDMLNQEWIRLKDANGHIGALYHPGRDIIRFVRGGTVDYNLAIYAPREPEKQTDIAIQPE